MIIPKNVRLWADAIPIGGKVNQSQDEGIGCMLLIIIGMLAYIIYQLS